MLVGRDEHVRCLLLLFDLLRVVMQVRNTVSQNYLGDGLARKSDSVTDFCCEL